MKKKRIKRSSVTKPTAKVIRMVNAGLGGNCNICGSSFDEDGTCNGLHIRGIEYPK